MPSVMTQLDPAEIQRAKQKEDRESNEAFTLGMQKMLRCWRTYNPKYRLTEELADFAIATNTGRLVINRNIRTVTSANDALCMTLGFVCNLDPQIQTKFPSGGSRPLKPDDALEYLAQLGTIVSPRTLQARARVYPELKIERGYSPAALRRAVVDGLFLPWWDTP